MAKKASTNVSYNSPGLDFLLTSDPFPVIIPSWSKCGNVDQSQTDPDGLERFPFLSGFAELAVGLLCAL